MDKRSLVHDAGSRQGQSLESESETLSNETPEELGLSCDMVQAMTFHLTFTTSSWRLLWRVLTIGSVLADELLELVDNPKRLAEPTSALLWNELSAKLARHG